MAVPRFARVYIQLKTRSLERAFDYIIPDELASKVGVGSVVLVPLARRKAVAVVSELSTRSQLPQSRLLPVEAVLDYPPIPKSLIELALWTAQHYCCSPAVALALVLPPGGLPGFERSGTKGNYSYSLKKPPVQSRKAQFVRVPGEEAPLAPNWRPTAARARLLELLAAGELRLTEAMEKASVSRATIRKMAELGAVEIFERELPRDGLRFYGITENEQPREALKLNPDQNRALEAITARLADTDPSITAMPILIQGVPGAGKTEVYIRAIEETLARGGRTIVLVPEISLTYQAVRRLRRRFGSRVGVLHSGLSTGERFDEYMRIAGGGADVVIGPRSALFCPLPDLKLIVLDEENDPSFKQENDPRYDARHVALERARREGACPVFGSATPSLESYHSIRERYELPDRATGAALPEVEVVDMRPESDPLFSARLIADLDLNITNGQKSILLLNSRGFARFLQCGNCGHVWRCPNCDISLTLHHGPRQLLCHHCGRHEEVPAVCPECSFTDLSRWGAGTQQLEQRLLSLFPGAPVFRMDADSTRGYGRGPGILDEFGRSEGGVLLGTQMVAKGHHFPDVTLAAVINADLSLQFPEFRAEERTFSLLLQLAGRSGRADLPGRVLIQTWNSDMQCIRMAADQAIAEFYAIELERRERLGYPPFIELVNVLCLSRNEQKAEKAAGFLMEKLAEALQDETLLGPAPLFRLKGWSRSHVLVKTGDLEATLKSMKTVVDHYRQPYLDRGVRIVVDVEPQWLS